MTPYDSTGYQVDYKPFGQTMPDTDHRLTCHVYDQHNLSLFSRTVKVISHDFIRLTNATFVDVYQSRLGKKVLLKKGIQWHP